MPEFPRMTAKEAERFLLQNGFVIDRQKVAIESIKKGFIEWLFLTIVERFCTLKS